MATFADVWNTPAYFDILDALIADGKRACDNVQNMRLVCRDTSTFPTGAGVAKPIMFIDSEQHDNSRILSGREHPPQASRPRRIDGVKNRYPKGAPPPTTVAWTPINSKSTWWFDPDPAWLGAVEHMDGDGPGMLRLLSKHYSVGTAVLPLGSVRRLVAADYELSMVPSLPALRELCMFFTNAVVRPYSVPTHLTSNLTVLHIHFEWLYGRRGLSHVSTVIRSAQDTLKELAVVGTVHRELDKLMDAVRSCKCLEYLDLSGLESEHFDGRHALSLPPSILDVRLNSVSPSGVAYMWSADMNCRFTTDEWRIDVNAYYVDIKGIVAKQCPRLKTVWHPGLEPFLGIIPPAPSNLCSTCLDNHTGVGCDKGVTARRECITCGCTRERDEYGERVCGCDLCAAKGCEFRLRS